MDFSTKQISTKQINMTLWVLFAVLLLLFLFLIANQVSALNIITDFSTNGHCVGGVCAW